MPFSSRCASRIFPVLLVSLGTSAALTAQSAGTDIPSSRLSHVAATLIDVKLGENQAPLQLDLASLMKVYNVPGLSVAVIDNFKIVAAQGFGVIGTGASQPVTTATLFQAGSISKPVAATGALYLVEQGKLSLDGDVNRWLKTWKLPENEFTKTEKVTLRRLMSHTAGMTVHGFPGYDVDEKIPTLVQVLNGEAPANTAPIRVDTVPGTLERYSGGGVTIEQQMMMDVTGKPFPSLLRELVLDKIGMTNSTYEQPLPPPLAAMTAIGTQTDGKQVHGRWHIYPEMAAAGLWTTPTDLSKFAIEIALSAKGKANRVLAEKTTREMLTPVKNEVGLGFFLEKDVPGQFGHGGSDEGFQSLLTMNSISGKGLVVMAGSDNGSTIAEYVRHRVAQEYGWDEKPSAEHTGEILGLVLKLQGVQSALKHYAYLQAAHPAGEPFNEDAQIEFGYGLLGSNHAAEAVSIFQECTKEHPDSAHGFQALGRAYLASGQENLARDSFETALKLAPTDQGTIDALNRLRRPAVQVAPAILESYVGNYQIAPGFNIKVTREGERLFAEPTGQARVELFPESEKDFFLKVVDARVTFVKGSGGKVDSIILHHGGDHEGKRVQ